MNEQFSAFLDNESSPDETDSVVNALLRDEGLRASWTRQHWLRTTLRSPDAALDLDPGFSGRVMQALAEQGDDETERPTHNAMPATGSVGRRRPRLRYVAGFAGLASAAGVVLLVSQSLQQQQPGVAKPELTLADSSSASAGPASASAGVASSQAEQVQKRPTRSGRRRPADHWSVSDPDLEDELNGYLVEHNGLARGHGLAGTTPAYVRVATYGQGAPR